MDVTGERKKVFLRNHLDEFFTGCFSRFLKIKIAFARNDKDIMFTAFSDGDKCLEDLFDILRQNSSHLFAGDCFFTVIFMNLIRDA